MENLDILSIVFDACVIFIFLIQSKQIKKLFKDVHAIVLINIIISKTVDCCVKEIGDLKTEIEKLSSEINAFKQQQKLINVLKQTQQQPVNKKFGDVKHHKTYYMWEK